MMGKKELQCKLKTAFIPYPHIVIHIPLTWHVAIDYKFNRLFKITLHTIRKKKTFNPLGASPTKWSNTLKQFVGILPTNCLSVFDHFVGMALKGLKDVLHNLHQLFTEGMWMMFSSLSNHRNLPTRFKNI